MAKGIFGGLAGVVSHGDNLTAVTSYYHGSHGHLTLVCGDLRLLHGKLHVDFIVVHMMLSLRLIIYEKMEYNKLTS
jgi:hypothetical protein